MRQTLVRRTSAVLMGTLFTVVLAARAGAVDRTWIDTSLGLNNWNDAANWNPSDDFVKAADNALFDADASYFVIVAAPSAASNVTFTDGNVTLGGGSLNSGGIVTIDDVLAAGLGDGAIVTLNGPNWDNVGNALVGDMGYGSLTVNGGADFRALNVTMGDDVGSTGEITVDGVGSLLTADTTGAGNGIFIGNAGTGTLNVTSGAIARTLDVSGIPDFNIGFAATGEGTLNIDGAGSQAIAEDMFVGYEGTGHLNITAGGVMNQTINTSPDAFVGYIGSASAGDITVNGDNSAWNLRDLLLGNAGTGTLNIEAGGKVDASGLMTLGAQATAVGTATVTGSGATDSLLEITGNLTVGQFGKGTLTAELGGDVTVGGSMVVGDDISNVNTNSVTITNAGSSLSVTGVMFVGNEGKGTLDVTDGASISGGNLRVAQNTGSTGDMTLRGGSTAAYTIDVAVGNDGAGTLLIDTASTMTVENRLWVGFDDGEGTVTVRDTGSELRVNTANAADVFIGGENGQTGGTGVVNIEDGGLFTTQRSVFIGGNSTGDGTVNVTGPGSVVQFYDNGAPTGTANEVTYIGYNGAGKMNITDGGYVRNEIVRIGEGTGSAAADAKVSGVNLGTLPGDPGDDTASTWDIVGDLVVGTNRLGTLTVEDGAQLASQTGGITVASYIGFGAASDGSTATVTGPGSQWLHEHFLNVANSGGNSANPVQLNVRDGGRTEATSVFVAVLDGSYGEINVDGAGSTLSLVTNAKSSGIGDIRLVQTGSNGTAILNVTGGGLVETASHLEIGRGDAAGNATVNVSGAGSRMDVGLDISVSYTGTPGTMNVANGGAVQNHDEAFIGRGSALGTANVGAAAGSDTGHAAASWTVGPTGTSPGMYIGGNATGNGLGGTGNAVTGILNVNPTGTVTVNGPVRVWNRGVINMNGGTLEFESINLTDSSTTIPNNPTFNFNSGTARFLGAGNLTSEVLTPMLGVEQTLGANQHLAVNGTATINTPLRVNGGTLSVGGTNVSSMANVDFDAGTLNFTNSGLSVSSTGLFGATLVVDDNQTINVANQLNVAGAGLLSIARGAVSANDAVNSGTTVVAGGSITVDTSFVNNGDLVLIDGTLNGNLTNNGDLTVVNTAGLGSLSLNGGGSASFGLDGNAGTADLLDVAGSALIGGALSVSAENLAGFALGQQFDLITAATVSGVFASKSLPSLGGGLGLEVLYESTRVALQVVNVAGVPGDYNQNGTVDAADYTLWRNNLGSGTALPNDDTPGVGQDDYARWKTHFGETAGSAAGAGSTTAVPEPATVGLLAVAFFAFVVRRKNSS